MARQRDTHCGCIHNDFRKSNYKQASPKPKLTGQQKPGALFYTSLESTQTQDSFSVLRVTSYKAVVMLPFLLQSLASLALVYSAVAREGRKRESSIAIEP